MGGCRITFDAFISYSHRADQAVAEALEEGLQRLARPWYRRQALSVFRDQSELVPTESLWSSIDSALGQTRYVLFLACPESATSPWCDKEVQQFTIANGTERLLLVRTGGVIDWDDAAGDFTEASDAVPPSLRGRFEAEPLWLDLAWARDHPHLTLRDPAWRTAVTHLAAPIRGVEPGALDSEDLRLQRRARRLARGAVAGLGLLTLASVAGGALAVRNARDADERAAEARSQSLGLDAVDLSAGEAASALLGAVAAADLAPGAPDAFRATQVLLARFDRLKAVRATGLDGLVNVRSLAVAGDGRIAATATAVTDEGVTDTELRFPTTGAAVRTPSKPAIDLTGFVGESDTLLAVTSSGDGGDAAPVLVGADGTRHDLPAGLVAAREPTGRGLVVDDTGAGIYDLATQQMIAHDDGLVHGTATMTSEVTATAVENTLVLRDLRSTAVLARGTLAAPPDKVLASLDGSTVVTVEADGVRRWRRAGDALQPGPLVATKERLSELRGSLVAGDHAVFDDGVARTVLVDLDDGSTVQDIEGVGTPDPADRYLAFAGDRFSVWDVAAAAPVISTPEPAAAVAWSPGCSPSSCTLATAGRSLDVWRLPALQRTTLAPETNAQRLAVSPDGGVVVSAGWGADVAVWSVRRIPDTTEPAELAPAGAPAALDLNSGDLITAAGDGVKVGDEVLPTGPVDEVLPTSGVRRLLVRQGAAWHLWDLERRAEVPLAPACASGTVAVSPKGTAMVALSGRRFTVCSTDDGRAVGAEEVGRDVDGDLVPAVDDDRSVAIGAAHSVVLYVAQADGFAPANPLLTEFAGRSGPVRSVALQDLALAAGLAGADDESTGRVVAWDLGARAAPLAFDVDERDVERVAFSEDASLIATAARDPGGPVLVQVWETLTRRRVGRAHVGPTDASKALAVTTDAEFVLLTTASGRTLEWGRGDSQDPVGQVCAIVGRDLTKEEWQAFTQRSHGYRPVCAERGG